MLKNKKQKIQEENKKQALKNEDKDKENNKIEKKQVIKKETSQNGHQRESRATKILSRITGNPR